MPRALSRRGRAHSGERDLLVTIHKVVQGTGDSGFPVEREGAAIQVWAKRDFVTVTERNLQDQLVSSSVQRWEIPYTVSLDADLVGVAKSRELVYQGKRYDIQAAEVMERNKGKAIVLTTLAKAD